MTSLTSIITLLLIITVTQAQKTFMRTCDCDYYADGKCAYTLLLPTEGACPSGNTSGGLDAIRAAVTQVESKVTDNTQHLAQVQNAIIDLYQKTPSDSLEAINKSVIAQSEAVDGLNDAVDELKERMNQLQTLISGIENVNGSLIDQDSKARIQSLEAKVTELNSQACSQKGALVETLISRDINVTLTASTTYPDHTPEHGRISNVVAPAAWCPDEPNLPQEYFQFDFENDVTVAGCMTRARLDYNQRVTSYNFQYKKMPSDDWTLLKDPLGETVTLPGNTDNSTVQFNYFPSVITGRVFQVIPLTAYRGGNKCMRLDLIGCLDNL